jgi:hypothetical protein
VVYVRGPEIFVGAFCVLPDMTNRISIASCSYASNYTFGTHCRTLGFGVTRDGVNPPQYDPLFFTADLSTKISSDGSGAKATAALVERPDTAYRSCIPGPGSCTLPPDGAVDQG